MFLFFLPGASLGLSAGLLPGPLQAFLIRTTLVEGWRRALVIMVSPMIADVPIIIAALLFLSQIPGDFISAIQVAGGLFLIWLAWGTWRDLRAGATIAAESAPAPARRRVLAQALLINWLSPGPYIFWTTVTGPLLIEALAQSVLHGVAFLVGFYGVFAATMGALIIVFERARHLDARIVRALLIAVVVIVVVFALSLIGRGVGIW